MSLASLVPSLLVGWIAPSAISRLQSSPSLPLSWHHLSFMVVSWILTCPRAIVEPILWFCLLVFLVLPMICCPRSGPPPDFEESTDRMMEWSPQQLSNQWGPQWLCLRCGRSMELSQIPQRPDIVCSQCGVNCPTMIMDCREGNRWMWCPHCQRREEISHVLPVSPTWFSHGPLTILVRLYAWGDSPILPPGAGSQSWLFCPLISLGLVHAERARSVCTLFYRIPHACTSA